MQRLVVLTVCADQVVDPLRVEGAHLLVDRGAAGRRDELLVGDLPRENGTSGVPERGEDHLAGVDQRAVEVEKDGSVAHQ